MDYHIDAKSKKLGRLASEIAVILQGKKNSHYNPRIAGSDRVFVKNVKHIEVTGRKMKEKIYYRHTGYVGHIKEETLERSLAKSPENTLREVVRKMLPKNFLNKNRLKNLIFVKEDK